MKKQSDVINASHPNISGEEKEPVVHFDDSNWLVSYADMMTLLCGFFIMLFSMARLDEGQYEVIKRSIAEQFGGQYEPLHADLNSFAKELVSHLKLNDSAQATWDASGVSILFESRVFFETLSAELTAEGRTLLAQVVEEIVAYQKKVGKKYRIIVEGHTDQRPVLSGVFPSNWELSGARAARVVRLFLDKGFSPQQMMAIGYADAFPEALPGGNSGHVPLDLQSAEVLAKNRRVVLRLIAQDQPQLPFPHVGENSQESLQKKW